MHTCIQIPLQETRFSQLVVHNENIFTIHVHWDVVQAWNFVSKAAQNAFSLADVQISNSFVTSQSEKVKHIYKFPVTFLGMILQYYFTDFVHN